MKTWRFEREYFYDAKTHGANWTAVYEKYKPLVASVGHRTDLDYLIAMVGGELTVGHSYLIGTGDTPGEEPAEQVGLLGADFTVENGKYRISHIYTGENWNPELQAPLSAPGIDVSEGDYLLEVNGRPLTAATNVYSLFSGTATHQTMIRVNKTPSLEGSRVLTVVPVASEDRPLRTRAGWKPTRRTVDRLSGGRLACLCLAAEHGGPRTLRRSRATTTRNRKRKARSSTERYNSRRHGGGLHRQ